LLCGLLSPLKQGDLIIGRPLRSRRGGLLGLLCGLLSPLE
jgi:hypothetical protein